MNQNNSTNETSLLKANLDSLIHQNYSHATQELNKIQPFSSAIRYVNDVNQILEENCVTNSIIHYNSNEQEIIEEDNDDHLELVKDLEDYQQSLDFFLKKNYKYKPM